MLRRRDIDEDASVELEGRFGAKNVKVQACVRMKETDELVEASLAGVQRHFGFAGIQHEAVVNAWLFGSQSVPLVGFYPREIFDTASGYGKVVSDEVFGSAQGCLGPGNGISAADVEVTKSRVNAKSCLQCAKYITCGSLR